jgi:hypothetical protein
MAIAYTTVAKRPDLGRATVDVTLDTSYPANGYVLSASQLGMISVDNVVPVMSTTEGVLPVYTAASAKLKIYKATGTATPFTEIASTDVTASTKVRCDVTGTPIL